MRHRLTFLRSGFFYEKIMDDFMRKVLPKIVKSVQFPAAMKGERVKGHAAALLAACLFGLMSPMCKFVMQDGTVNGISLALMRVICSAVLFWVTSCFVKSQKIRREDCAEPIPICRRSAIHGSDPRRCYIYSNSRFYFTDGCLIYGAAHLF